MKPLRIGNAQGFWGDQQTAPLRLVKETPDLDFLTLDYLAEVSLSILAIQQEKDPEHGYARDFVDVIRSLTKPWLAGHPVKVVTNAGGLNPRACAEACRQVLHEAGCHKTIAIVTGDDVIDIIKTQSPFNNLDNGAAIDTVRDRLVTANAYLGAHGIVEALDNGADIVITGRTADPSLTVAPCVHYYKWSWDDYDKLAGATIAGHLIECGTQATGGISSDWLTIENPAEIGFPIVAVHEDGSFIITKSPESSGRVDIGNITEQLLYEIGDPGNYLSPDVTVSFLNLALEQIGSDAVKVSGAVGKPPPPQYKVSATYRNGYKSEGTLAIFGADAKEKAQHSGEVILQRLRNQNFPIENARIDCIGNDTECILRIAVSGTKKEAITAFTKEIAPLVTSGPQGVTGYTSGRPPIRTVFGFWPCLIKKDQVQHQVQMLEVS